MESSDHSITYTLEINSSCVIVSDLHENLELRVIQEKLRNHFDRKQLLENDEVLNFLKCVEAFKPTNKKESFYKSKFQALLQTILKSYKAFFAHTACSSGYLSSSTFRSHRCTTDHDNSSNPPADVLPYLTDNNFITVDPNNEGDKTNKDSSDLFGSKNDVVVIKESGKSTKDTNETGDLLCNNGDNSDYTIRNESNNFIASADVTELPSTKTYNEDYNRVKSVAKNKDVFINDSPSADEEIHEQVQEETVDNTITISITEPKLDLFEQIGSLHEISEKMRLYVSKLKVTTAEIIEQFKQLSIATKEAERCEKSTGVKRKRGDTTPVLSEDEYRTKEIVTIQKRILKAFEGKKFDEDGKIFKRPDWRLIYQQ